MSAKIEGDELDVLLMTKLSNPPTRPGLIVRSHLLARLDEGVRHKFTLLSAAAGFGKTTLLSAWVEMQTAAVAWVSLDAGDNDPTLFWKYIIASLDSLGATVQPNIGSRVLPLLCALQPPPLEVILTVLINTLTMVTQDFVLILDEYQMINTPAIHNALAFLLEHMPPRMHVIVASRSEPELPLARLRVGGQLTEIRTNDLRFTPEEATLFLQQATQRPLSSEQIQALETRTEGWIAGLQLAALSLHRCENDQDFITAFTGSNRYVLEYLVEEVFSRQPEQIQVFLLQTSVLERLNGSLCDDLTEQKNGHVMLEQLEDANLFIEALDRQRSWYRYHRLFAEVMRQRLQRTYAERIPRLYQKACIWYEQNGFFVEAVDAALSGEDYERAGVIIDRVSAEMMRRGEMATLQRWLKVLPDDIVRSHSGLCLCSAWVLYIAVQFDASETYITQAEKLLAAARDEFLLPTNRVEHVAAEIATLRAVLAIARQDIPHVLEFAQYALQHLAAEDRGGRALVTWALGVAYWFADNVEEACNAVTRSVAPGYVTDSPYAVLNALGDLVQLQLAQGRLQQAKKTCQQGLQFVEEHRDQLPANNTMQIAYGELQREWNDLEDAAEALTQEIEQELQMWNLGNTLRRYIALARTKQAQGDGSSAQEAIQKAERIADQQHLPHLVAIVRAYGARLQLQRGESSEAVRWAEESRLRIDDSPLHHTREVEYLSLARVCIVQNQTEEALQLLTRLLDAAERGKRIGSVIEILALTALAQEKQSKRTEALTSLARSLAYAEPEGYIRMFADEGSPMTALLKCLQRQSQGRLESTISPKYIVRLLNVFETEQDAPRNEVQETSQGLVEPLSKRECEVLHLLAKGASNREIAETLIVSLGTVKKHLNNIFGKLGVTTRTHAVAQARSLGLLA